LASPVTEDGSARRLLGTVARAKKSPLRELTERTLLEQSVPAAVLVDERGEIQPPRLASKDFSLVQLR
jgi:hypothetical protein